jgi:ferredoxin
MKESTRNIFRMHAWRVDRALHNYLYFTQYDRYVDYFLRAGRAVVKGLWWLPLLRRAFQMVFNRYHAKVLTESDVSKILSLERSISFGPESSERVIPFPYAHRIILSEPDFIAVMDCPCRLSRERPCEPVNVCLAVGRITAQFWLEHGRRFHARKVSQEEALGLIKSERSKGHITTAWFKVATGGRTGVICSCCSCCCGGLEGMRLARQLPGAEKMSNLIPSGYVVRRRDGLCRSCGGCAKVCLFGAMTMSTDGRPLYEEARCMGCGLCVEHCEQEALFLHHDPAKGDPLDLELLQARAGGDKDQAGGGRDDAGFKSGG